MSVPTIRFAEFNEPWSIRAFGSLGSFKSGTGFPDAEQGGTTGTPFYKVSDMNLPANSDVMQDANHHVTQEQIDRNRWKPITAASIIFAKVGAAIMLERKRKAAGFLIDNNMMAFTPSSELDYDFCIQLLRNTEFSRYAQTGALPSYNAGDLSGIDLIIPSFPEQRRIADALSAVDAKIDLLGRKRDALARFKAGLMQKLFSQEVRFMREDGSAYPNWEEKPIGSLLAESPSSPAISGTPRISVSLHLNGLSLRDDSSETTTIYYARNAGDFIYGKQNIHNGALGLIPYEYDGFATTADIPCFRFNDATTNRNWFVSLISHIYRDFAALMKGTGSKRLKPADFLSAIIMVPDADEQCKIADALSILDNRICQANRQISTMQAFKKGLLQQMFV